MERNTYAVADTGNHDDLVVEYAPLVKRIAYHMVTRLPASIQPDDLIQAGMIGLLEASRNYNASHGASFETYAGIRIRGAMIDEIRRNDWAPRSVHRKLRNFTEATRRVEGRKGRDAKDHEVAAELGLELEEYHLILRDISGHRIVSFEDISQNSDVLAEGMMDKSNDPMHDIQLKDVQAQVARAIAGLPERERLVLALYYDEELNLREIGEVLGVSESRVCQIHGQALIRLQSYIAKSGQNDLKESE